MSKYVLTADVHFNMDTSDMVLSLLNTMLSEQPGHTLAVLGDMFDIRHTVPVVLLNKLHNFLNEHGNRNFVFLPGNHDQVDVEGRNILEVFERSNVKVLNNPVEIDTILWLPYRKSTDELYAEIDKSTAKYCFLHHGVASFPMNDHVIADETQGIRPSALKKFSHVYCGHWHKPVTISNITYVGSPYQVKRDEIGQEKRYITLSTVNGSERSNPLSSARKFYKATDLSNADGLKSSDEITLTASAKDLAQLKDQVDQLRQRGVLVRLEVQQQEEKRTSRAAGANTLQEVVNAYVKDNAKDDEFQALIGVFNEIHTQMGGA